MREFSPIFTERATNITDAKFKQAMQEVSAKLKDLYHAHTALLLPGSGTFAMEAVARQYAQEKRCYLISNGYFGQRWEQILSQGNICKELKVRKAELLGRQYRPPLLDTLLQEIKAYDLVFLSHVDTSTGIQMPEQELRQIAQHAHQQDSLLIVDGIASGCSWLNMHELGIDVLVTAPQKGLSAQAGGGIVLLNERAYQRLENTTSNSYSMDLRQWLSVMQAYQSGGFKYHTTLPTEVILSLQRGLQDIFSFGTEKAKQTQQELGISVRRLLQENDFHSVAAAGYQAPSVLVYDAGEKDPQAVIKSFSDHNLRIGGSLPFLLDEGEVPRTFRIGLLGIEKMQKKEEVIALLEGVLGNLTRDFTV